MGFYSGNKVRTRSSSINPINHIALARERSESLIPPKLHECEGTTIPRYTLGHGNLFNKFLQNNRWSQALGWVLQGHKNSNGTDYSWFRDNKNKAMQIHSQIQSKHWCEHHTGGWGGHKQEHGPLQDLGRRTHRYDCSPPSHTFLLALSFCLL